MKWFFRVRLLQPQLKLTYVQQRRRGGTVSKVFTNEKLVSKEIKFPLGVSLTQIYFVWCDQQQVYGSCVCQLHSHILSICYCLYFSSCAATVKTTTMSYAKVNVRGTDSST